MITTPRIKNTYTRYVSKACSVRINMPRKSSTLEEIDKLIRLKVVKKVSPSTITYTSEFKVKIA